MITLESERLIIRNYKESDLPEYYALFSDKENMYFVDDLLVNTLDEALDSLREAIKVNEDKKGRRFCVVLKEGGEDKIIAGVGYDICAETPLGKIGHMGWFLMPEYHNKGYITEAAKRVLEYAFLQDNCIRITTACYSNNIPSQTVMKKVGFRKEGQRVKAQWHDGIMKDRLEFAMNKDEFISFS